MRLGKKQLPRQLREAWRISLPIAKMRALAVADLAPTGWLVLSTGFLSRYDTRGWQHWEWREIQTGRWQAPELRLTWLTYHPATEYADLRTPGPVPELFRELINSSIAVHQRVPVQVGERELGFTITARRSLAEPSAELQWHTDLGRGLTWKTPGVAELAAANLERLRSQFDPNSS